MMKTSMIIFVAINLAGIDSRSVNVKEVLNSESNTKTPETSVTDEYGRGMTAPTSDPLVTESSASVKRVLYLNEDDSDSLCYHEGAPKTKAEEWKPGVESCAQIHLYPFTTSDNEPGVHIDCHIHGDNFRLCVERSVVDDIKYCLGESHELVEAMRKVVDEYVTDVCGAVVAEREADDIAIRSAGTDVDVFWFWRCLIVIVIFII